MKSLKNLKNILRVIFIGVIAVIAVEAQASSRPPIFNEFICKIGGEINKFELYENKSVLIKMSQPNGKVKIIKGRWSKNDLEILIEVKEERFTGKPAWYPDGMLILGRKGNVTYNNPAVYEHPQKCFMK